MRLSSFLQKFATGSSLYALAISSRLSWRYSWLVIFQRTLFAMARIAFLFASAVLINFAAAFVPSSVQGAAVGAGSSSNAFSSSSALGMAETDAYDVVKVDLDDGRDYPIYIGAEFDEAEGEQKAVFAIAWQSASVKLVKCRFVHANLVCLVLQYCSVNSRRLLH